jgi:hypothetical protein
MEPRVFEGAVRALQRLTIDSRDGNSSSRNERRPTFRRCEGAG